MKIRPIELLVTLVIKIMRIFSKRDTLLNKQGVHRIVVFSMTAIGDMFMSSPALRAIRKAYPQQEIVLVIHPNYLDLFKNLPDTDGFLTYNGSWKSFLSILKQIRCFKPDLAVILHGNEPQATPLAYLSGAKWRFKLPLKNKNAYLLSPFPDSLWDKDFFSLHAIEKRLRTARLAGCSDISDTRLYSPLTKELQAISIDLVRSWNTNAGEKKRWIGFQIGASKPHRTWPLEYFALLAQRLHQLDPSLGFILTGSPQERDKCEQLKQKLPISISIVNMAGQVPLAQLPSVLTGLECLVTGDTGTMHMAVAIQTPIVGLFGSANSKITGPYQDLDKHRIIQKWQTCSPCLGDKCQYYPAKCMMNIEVDEVFDAVLSIISSH